MGKFNIMITGIGTTTALSVLKGLKRQDQYAVTTVGTDADPLVSGRYLVDKFYTVPTPKEEGKFVERMTQIVEDEKIDLVVPIIDFEFPLWARLKEESVFKKTCILIPSSASLKICQDKYATTCFLKELGLPTIPSYEETLQVTRFPVLIRPRHFGRSSLNCFKADDKNELALFAKKMDRNYFIQDYVEGEEYTIDCLSTLEGSFLNGLVRKRIATKGGLSVKAEVVKDEEALRVAGQIVASLKLPGVANIQFFRNREGCHFFDVNPRFAGGHAFTIEAGLNTIYHILRMLEKKRVSPGDIRIQYGLKMVRFWDEIIVSGDQYRLPGLFKK